MGLPVDQPASPGQSMTRLHCSRRLQEGCWGREGPGVTTPASEMPVNAAADETAKAKGSSLRNFEQTEAVTAPLFASSGSPASGQSSFFFLNPGELGAAFRSVLTNLIERDVGQTAFAIALQGG